LCPAIIPANQKIEGSEEEEEEGNAAHHIIFIKSRNLNFVL
jgi:hypothetical protein